MTKMICIKRDEWKGLKDQRHARCASFKYSPDVEGFG